ncbi:MAG: cytochrome c [Candidatus Methylacidiphilales bacterium]|nr:cytochrome c [Candidatus Methylacidiphilales bacterium]
MSANEHPHGEQEPVDPRLPGIDYDETTNVQRIHESILREKVDPAEGMEPMPLWLIALILVVVLFGGYYLGQYNGGFSATGFDENAGTAVAGATTGGAAGAAKVDENSPEALAKLGKRVFTTNCASCHTPTGMGVAGQYPPLVASPYVLEKPHRLVSLVLHGLQGEIVVLGNKYNNAMPAWEKQLNDKQMAAVLTYIRNEWGNKADPIKPEQVAAVRKEWASRTTPWTAPELETIPGDLPAVP